MLKFKKNAQLAEAKIASYDRLIYGIFRVLIIIQSIQTIFLLTTRPRVYSKFKTFFISVKKGTEHANNTEESGA